MSNKKNEENSDIVETILLLEQLIKKQDEALSSARELLSFKDLLIELKEREIDDYKRITRNFYIISSVFALGFLLFILYTSLLK
jgi:hypothetical protein